MKQALQWQDYEPEQAALVNAWLDREAIRDTGLADGFDAFYQYWKNETDPARGESFWCKLVSEEQRPFAAVAYAAFRQTVTVMEIVVDPALRGQGREPRSSQSWSPTPPIGSGGRLRCLKP